MPCFPGSNDARKKRQNSDRGRASERIHRHPMPAPCTEDRGKGGEYVHKRVFIQIRIETEIKYIRYGQEEKKSKLAQKGACQRQAVTSSLALQQKSRMLARIRYYKCFGVDKSPADIQNRGWPRDQFMYFKGAGTELIIGGRLSVEMPARFANDVRNAWSSGHKRENSRYRDRDYRRIAE